MLKKGDVIREQAETLTWFTIATANAESDGVAKGIRIAIHEDGTTLYSVDTAAYVRADVGELLRPVVEKVTV